MVRANKANACAGAILTLFALYVVYESLQLPLWTEVGPGAGSPPLVFGLILAALSAALLVRSLHEKDAEAGSVDFSRWSATAKVLAGYAATILLAGTLGMLLTIGLFMAYHALVVERMSWKLAVLAAVGTALGFYLVFERWLEVPLVIGVFGI
jgi:hypothetical protein